MMLRIIQDAWIRILIAFDVRDPLKRNDAHYVLPEGYSDLPVQARLRATLCDLFGNMLEPIADIARSYEMTQSEVIALLIEEGLLKDQRRNRPYPIKGGRRPIDLSSDTTVLKSLSTSDHFQRVEPSRSSGTLSGKEPVQFRQRKARRPSPLHPIRSDGPTSAQKTNPRRQIVP